MGGLSAELLASAGTFLHTGLKVPYFIWFGKNNCSNETWQRAKEPPWNMIMAMAITAFLCIFIGCYTPYLYHMLPYPVDYHPYNAYHIFETLQFLAFTAVGFFLLIKKLTPEPTISLDLDWFYRKGGRAFAWLARKPIQWADTCVGEIYRLGGLIPLMKSARGCRPVRQQRDRRHRGRPGRHRPGNGTPPPHRPTRRGAGKPGPGLCRGGGDWSDSVAHFLKRAMTLPPPTEAFPVLSVLIFSPLVVAAIAAFIRNERALRWWTLAGTLAIAGYSLPLYFRFDASTAAFQFVENAPWIRTLNINYTLGVDGISLLLVLLTTLIMPLCVLASWRYITMRVKEFMICMLIMETAMIGVFCALDFVLFFIFWESMLIPMSLMIGIWGGPRKIYAAVKFFIYTMTGSILLLVAIIALFLQVGSFSIPEMMGTALLAHLPMLDLSRVLHFVRHQSAHVPVPYLVAGGPRGSPDRRQRAARQHPAQNGHLRFPAFLPADHALRHARFPAVHAGTLDCGHPVRRLRGTGAE